MSATVTRRPARPADGPRGGSSLVVPGHGAGLLDVVRRRFLLRLLVRKELRVRYRASVLGLAWSYVKPGVQYVVYFLALGVFLSLRDSIPDYAVYLFSGMIVVNLFSESLANATRSVVGNADLVKKIYLPRELFPVASVWVAIVHFFPQLVVLLVGALIAGWRPEVLPLLGAVAGFVIVVGLATGVGLIASALNTIFRDLENLVDLVLMVAVWVSPVLYSWQRVRDVLAPTSWSWLVTLYQAEPGDGGRGAVPLGVLVHRRRREVGGPDRAAPAPALARRHRPGDHRGGAGGGPAGLPPRRGPLRPGAVMGAHSADRPSTAVAVRPTAVEVSDVSMRFTLRSTRSLKEMAVYLARGKDLSNSFDALRDVSLTISQGETVGLLGYNGSGKSTLLKLISGVMRPSVGQVRVRGRIAGLIEVGAGFHPDLTGRENVYMNGAILGMDEATIRARFDDIVAFSEIERFIDTEVKHYSSGMFLRLAFAVAVHTDPEVFLIDEILAVGDEPFQAKCLARVEALREEGRTLVVVSHDLGMVERLCTRGVVLRAGEVIADTDARSAVAALRATG